MKFSMAIFQYECRMLAVVLWKSWRIRKHRKWQTLIEICAPVLLVLLLVSVKAVMEPDSDVVDNYKPTIFPTQNMKSLTSGLCSIGCSVQSKTAILAYAPNTTFINELMTHVGVKIKNNGADLEIHGFKSEQEVEALASLLQQNSSGYFGSPSSLTGAVIFVNNPGVDTNLVYKIRLLTWKFITGKQFPDIEIAGPGKQYVEYEKTGFLGLQFAIDDAFIQLISTMTNVTADNFVVETKPFPYPPYRKLDKSHYTMVLSTLLPSAIIIGFVYMISISIKVIVEERVTGVKQFLTMLGLSHVGYWFGWFFDLFCVALVSIIFIVLILTTNLTGDGAALVTSSTSVIWTFLLLYAVSALWFCFFIANLLRSASYARGLAAVIWFGTFIVPAILVGTSQRFLATQFLIAISPNMCLFWGFNIIATWESRVVGIKWSNMQEYASATHSLNMASMFSMLIFNSIFYFLLTVIIRHPLIANRRLKKPYQLLYDALYDDTKFPELIRFFKKGCKFIKKSKAVDHPGKDVQFESPVGALRMKVLDDMGLLHSDNAKSPLTEPVEQLDSAKECGVKIRNMTKSFNLEMIKGFTCDFYVNEISCILGDSGSGKTILIDILLGVIKGDEGIAYVNSYDINDYLPDVKRSVGFCPQKNMLFADLSVMEHLLLFGWLKGKDWSSTMVQARHVATILKLNDALKTPAKKLTKSTKRLLCCAIAMMGNPKVIILDDPVHDMDVDTSKIFWNALLKYKEGRTIIFSSESIENAADIADRIAIINDGKLRCFGTPQYLNSVFGDGYTIKLSIADSAERLVRMICSEMEHAHVKNRTLTVGGEDVTFIVPQAYAFLFPRLFYQLYDNKDALGLITVQIDSLSVEDVFHSVHEMREFKQQPLTPILNVKSSSSTDVSNPAKKSQFSNSSFFIGAKSSGCRLAFIRFWALLVKNYRLSCSQINVLIFQVLIPVILIISGVNGANRALRNQDIRRFGQINIGLDGYRNPITLYGMTHNRLKMLYPLVVGNYSNPIIPQNIKISDALLEAGEKNIAKYRHNYLVAANETNSSITAMYSTVPFNSPPLSLNLVTNTILRTVVYPNSKQRIIVENHPLKNSSGADETTSSVASDSGGAALLKSLCLNAYALALICAMVAVKPMLERVSGSHHLQTMSGVNPFTFWASYLILDGLYVTVFAGVAVLIFFFAQERYLFTMHGGSVALFLIFLLGGFAVVCFGYFFSQVVNDAASSFVWLNMLHLLAVLGSHIMFRTHDGINDGVSELYFWLITPFPIPFMVHSFYVYGKVVIDNSRCELVAHHFSSGICKRKGLYIHLPAYSCCAQCNSSNCFQPRNYFDASYGYESYTLTRDLVIMGLVALIYFVLVVLMDYNYFQKLNRYFLSAPSEDFSSERGEKDPSAAQEAENVRRLIGLGVDVPDDEGLLVDNLCRNHGNIGEIYSQVSFDVKKGQCFGLLGLGDAKSLVFKTLTGEILPDVGDSVIPPYSMLRNRRQFTTNIGYCPQANCVFSGLTARETLQLYGSLKGICLSDLMTEVRQWLSALGLENDSNLLCGNFTPGMKRRLCVAVALIGNPQVIILDEPSRDIDPSMKKYIWGTLQRLQKDGKVILLASQNVHECENLCGKLGLMVHGRLQYVGSAREIKSRFLNGYTVTFKLTKRYSVDDASDLETVSDIKTSIEACLDDALFRDAFQNTLKYLIPQKTQNWGSIVERLEKIRTQLSASVAYYSMTESTLEEVFNAMDDLELESTNNELPGTRMTPFQRLCLGQCCTDDYS